MGGLLGWLISLVKSLITKLAIAQFVRILEEKPELNCYMKRRLCRSPNFHALIMRHVAMLFIFPGTF